YNEYTSKIYHIWHPEKKLLFETQSVEFDESSFQHPEILPSTPSLNLFDESSDDECNQPVTGNPLINKTPNSDDLDFTLNSDKVNDPASGNINITSNHQEQHLNQDPEAHDPCDSSSSQTEHRERMTEYLPPETTRSLAQIRLDRQLKTIARKEKEAQRIQKLQEQAIARGDRRSGRERKPTAKALEMQTMRQRSGAAIEQAFATAQYERVEIPASFEDAIKGNDAVNWIEAYESEMNSLWVIQW
ncbi:hypothetical protein K3495_g16472, partial [Podosphaera aphanis]